MFKMDVMTTMGPTWPVAAGMTGFAPLRVPGRRAANEGEQITALHAEHLYTRDWVPVNVVVTLHWSIRDLQKAAAVAALAQSNVRSASQASLSEVVGATMLGELLVEHVMVEPRLCRRMTGALADLGIELHACRIRDVSVPPAVRDAGVGRVLEQLDEALSHHRLMRLAGPWATARPGR